MRLFGALSTAKEADEAALDAEVRPPALGLKVMLELLAAAPAALEDGWT
jgi:hypothetical protein